MNATMLDPTTSWYLKIDLGTGGVKVAAVRRSGQVVADQFVSIETTLTGDGGATQDVAKWWTAMSICDRGTTHT